MKSDIRALNILDRVQEGSAPSKGEVEKETTGHRGRDIQSCKSMLYEAGYDYLLISPEKSVSLKEAYKE